MLCDKIILNANDPAAKADIFAYSPLPDLVLAVGSGTVNDSCRVASYRLNLPYAIVGTAPSMDGYASAGSPFLFNGSKATVQATTPKYIIADLDVMKDAPWDMMLAGIGDMFGKYTGMLDWELARDYTGEYFCEKIGKDVIDATDKCLENGYTLTDVTRTSATLTRNGGGKMVLELQEASKNQPQAAKRTTKQNPIVQQMQKMQQMQMFQNMQMMRMRRQTMQRNNNNNNANGNRGGQTRRR